MDLMKFTIENVSGKTFDNVIQIQNEEQFKALCNTVNKAFDVSGKPLVDAYKLGELAGVKKAAIAIGIGAGIGLIIGMTYNTIMNKKNKID